MTTRIPLKFGCVAMVESDEIDRSPAAPPKQPVLPHGDQCLCAQCREANQLAAI